MILKFNHLQFSEGHMAKYQKIISSVKEKILTKFKTIKIEFKENYQKAKTQPISKRKSALLGFTTVLGSFGLALFTPRMAAFAKDIPQKTPTDSPKPNNNQLTPRQPGPNILNVLSGAAASICAAAVGSGSFLVGIICGAVVAGGILYAQRHK